MYDEELSTEREKLQVSGSGVSIPTRISLSLSVIHTPRNIAVFVHPEILIQTIIPWKHETPEMVSQQHNTSVVHELVSLIIYKSITQNNWYTTRQYRISYSNLDIKMYQSMLWMRSDFSMYI